QEALADRKAMEQRVNDELHALGGTEAVVHRAMASLRAGRLTAEARELIRGGHLSKDLEMPDVDVLLEGVSAPKKRVAPTRATVDRRAEEREAERQKQEQLRVARAHVVETTQVRAAARTRLRAAQRELAAAEREVAAAEEAHTEARQAAG